MKQKGKYLLFSREEFADWLFRTMFRRKITLVQNHHTAMPDYESFHGSNHFILLESMETYHVEDRGFSEIAQNLTTFPDGTIAIWRSFETMPAGIRGANTGALCIENLGNFNTDIMADEHRKTILFLNAALCKRFAIPVDTDHIVYHHWYDLNTGKRRNGAGTVKSCPAAPGIGVQVDEPSRENDHRYEGRSAAV